MKEYIKSKKFIVCTLCVIFGCVSMGLVDAVLQPGYLIKSAIKLVLFTLLPLAYFLYDKNADVKKILTPSKKGILIAVSMGIGLYALIVLTFLAFRNVFDFSKLTESLGKTTGVTKENFIFVALYISFINSLLEEFFFRGSLFSP